MHSVLRTFASCRVAVVDFKYVPVRFPRQRRRLLIHSHDEYGEDSGRLGGRDGCRCRYSSVPRLHTLGHASLRILFSVGDAGDVAHRNGTEREGDVFAEEWLWRCSAVLFGSVCRVVCQNPNGIRRRISLCVVAVLGDAKTRSDRRVRRASPVSHRRQGLLFW